MAEFEWDAAKAAANFRKHGVEFVDAAAVLFDAMALTTEDLSSAERRFVTLGNDAMGRLLVVVYTWRGGKVRIVSARKATPRERKLHEG